jgi:hypothetical protein
MRFRLTHAFMVALLVTRSTSASAEGDADQAYEQLKVGFALRHDGKFEEALPHLVESFRLAPGFKVLLNLADCEEHVGHLVEAEQHWVQARDLAHADGNGAIEQEAADRLQQLQKRTPRLTVALAPGAPPSSHVERDGQELGSASLGLALPYNPGLHVIETRADARAVVRTEVTLREGDAKRVEVAPGPALAPEASPQPVPPASVPEGLAPTAPPPSVAQPAEPATTSLGWPGTFAIGLGAAGVAGIIFGAVEGLAAQRQHDEAVNACGANCSGSASAQNLQSEARTDATISNVGLIGGGIFVLASVALLVIPELARKEPAPSSGFRAAQTPRIINPIPRVGRSKHGMVVEVVF